MSYKYRFICCSLQLPEFSELLLLNENKIWRWQYDKEQKSVFYYCNSFLWSFYVLLLLFSKFLTCTVRESQIFMLYYNLLLPLILDGNSLRLFENNNKDIAGKIIPNVRKKVREWYAYVYAIPRTLYYTTTCLYCIEYYNGRENKQ